MHVLEDWYPVKPTAFILLMTELPGHHEELKDKIAKKKTNKTKSTRIMYIPNTIRICGRFNFTK